MRRLITFGIIMTLIILGFYGFQWYNSIKVPITEISSTIWISPINSKGEAWGYSYLRIRIIFTIKNMMTYPLTNVTIAFATLNGTSIRVDISGEPRPKPDTILIRALEPWTPQYSYRAYTVSIGLDLSKYLSESVVGPDFYHHLGMNLTMTISSGQKVFGTWILSISFPETTVESLRKNP